MASPINQGDFERWNTEERLYGCMMFHRLERKWWQRALRRPRIICPHVFHAVTTRREAFDKARGLSEEFPCIVVLIDVEEQEVVCRFVTDPDAISVDVGVAESAPTGGYGDWAP